MVVHSVDVHAHSDLLSLQVQLESDSWLQTSYWSSSQTSGYEGGGARARLQMSPPAFFRCRAVRADATDPTTTPTAISICRRPEETTTVFIDKAGDRYFAILQLILPFSRADVRALSQVGWEGGGGGGGRVEERLPAAVSNKKRLSHTKRLSLSSDQVTVT